MVKIESAAGVHGRYSHIALQVLLLEEVCNTEWLKPLRRLLRWFGRPGNGEAVEAVVTIKGASVVLWFKGRNFSRVISG